MFDAIVRTEARWAPALARLVLGLVLLPHGAQKALGLFGGPGIGGFTGFAASIGIPAAVAWLVIAIEFLGAIGLVVGLLGRVAALGVVGLMLGIIMKVHGGNGFFMNWSGQQAGEGYEYHLLAIGLGLVVLLEGSGAASIDRALTGRRSA